MGLFTSAVVIACGVSAAKNLKELGITGVIGSAKDGIKAAHDSAKGRVKEIRETCDTKAKEVGMKALLEDCSPEQKAEILKILKTNDQTTEPTTA